MNFSSCIQSAVSGDLRKTHCNWSLQYLNKQSVRVSGLGYKLIKEQGKECYHISQFQPQWSSLMEQRLTFLNPFIIISELHSTETFLDSSIADIIFQSVLISHTRDFVLCIGFLLYVFDEWHIKIYKRKIKVHTGITK